ncbi:hypothetical protein JM82_1250 [Olleya sp. Hel_I_94]|jgi:hypothetical protein|nr:hypothetical protein JM82_1250 [Olleya sp. Hel_I_94]
MTLNVIISEIDTIWLQKLTTILSIALLIMIVLCALNIYKVYQLKKEIKRLKTKQP